MKAALQNHPETMPRTSVHEAARAVFTAQLPRGARILIVCEDDATVKRLRSISDEVGLTTETAHSITQGCELAKSGRFQVVLSAPALRDGSWRRVTDLARHYDLRFELVLLGGEAVLAQDIETLDDDVFDVVDPWLEQPELRELIRRAVWAAYLRGAGPFHKVANPPRAA